ncbi:MAG: DUF4845 domain-containing protein [Gammaproteobacteria bacterium]|jgi:hypothetical protein|nr:DUF4845 domain-containing protein [Gammaproteobacteria bacterium]
MRREQRGITTIGLLILLAFLGLAGFAVIQLVPVYLENMKIQQVLNQAKDKLDGQKATVTDIRKALGNSVNIEDLREVDVKKDIVIERSKDGYTVSIDYQREKTFIANVYLVAKFDHSVEILR